MRDAYSYRFRCRWYEQLAGACAAIALLRLSSEQWRAAGADELRATVDGYVSYFGTYTVDAAKGVVVHHVTADVRREYTGTDQERPFRVSGDELLIGDGKTWLRRFTRAPDIR